jgi:hypothetical protein
VFLILPLIFLQLTSVVFLKKSHYYFPGPVESGIVCVRGILNAHGVWFRWVLIGNKFILDLVFKHLIPLATWNVKRTTLPTEIAILSGLYALSGVFFSRSKYGNNCSLLGCWLICFTLRFYRSLFLATCHYICCS